MRGCLPAWGSLLPAVQLARAAVKALCWQHAAVGISRCRSIRTLGLSVGMSFLTYPF
jgi:hypothetical protein